MIITFEFKPKTKFLFALISPLFIWILKLIVQALELQQLPVSPLLNNLPIPQHKNPLTLLNRAQPVRNHNRRPADLRPVQRLLHNLLRFSVQRRRRLIEQQNLRLPDQRSRDRNPLLFAATQLASLLSHNRLIFLGQTLNPRLYVLVLCRVPPPSDLILNTFFRYFIEDLISS